MEIYTYDETFNQQEIVDKFKSLVWTERYADAGDFSLAVQDSYEMRGIFREGYFVSIPDTRDFMQIETRSSESGILTVGGPSLISVLKNRMVRPPWDDTRDYLEYNGIPQNVADQIVKDMCVPTIDFGLDTTLMNTGRIIPNGKTEVIPKLTITSTAATVGTSVTIPVQKGNVFDAVKSVLDGNQLGFRMTLPYTDSFGYGAGINYETYAGVDHSSLQSANPVIRFEPALDSLTDAKELRSISGFKNVAYVFPPPSVVPAGQRFIGIAYAPGYTAATLGFQRRTLAVDADDINDANVSGVFSATFLQTLLDQRAKDALANNNYVRMVDGKLVPQTQFAYGLDYKLGDIIDLRTDVSEPSQARITEYIRTYDSSGSSAYPTLSVLS